MAKKVSIKDIAQRVGVSTALVSFVLNGKEKEKRVGAEVAEKILEVAKELNYKPNQIARSLRKGSTMTLGLIVADIANPFFAQLARIIEDEANRYGYTVIFGSSDENSAKSASLGEIFLNRQVDGFVIVPAEGSQEQIRNLVQKNVPVVLMDRFFSEIQSSYVVLDNYNASFDAIDHLQAGYKRIGVISYKSSMIHMHDRVAGCIDAMKQRQSEENLLIREVSFNHTRQDIEAAISDLVIKTKKVDALYFVTNSLTLAGLYSLNKFKIKVPEDVAIMGFDGNEAFDFFYSPVSYVEQPINEMGKESVRVLVDLINGSEKTTIVKLKHKLILRESTEKTHHFAKSINN